MSHASNELGEYLRTRRSLVLPADAGLPVETHRKVKGLRREEVAELAGVSSDYYVRLEQGRARHPSSEVLRALGRVLLLGSAERAHLSDLAAAARKGSHPAAPRQQPVRASVLRSVTHINDIPAIVMNDRNDVLAWNLLATDLIADFPNIAEPERNMAYQIFLNPHARRVHPDWEEAARTTVGILRLAVGRKPHDRRLHELLGSLTAGSSEFATLWATRYVHEKSHGTKRFTHSGVGEIRLSYDTFRVPDDDGIMLVTYEAEPGSSDERALQRLAASRGVRGEGGSEERLAGTRG